MCCGTDEKSSCNLKHIRGFPLTDYVHLVLACKLAPKRTIEMEKRYSLYQSGRWQTKQARELTYKACFGWLQDKYISTPLCQNLKSLCRAWTGFSQVSRFSQHLALSRLLPWKQLPLWKQYSNNRRWGEESLIAWFQFLSQPGVGSSRWPPPTCRTLSSSSFPKDIVSTHWNKIYNVPDIHYVQWRLSMTLHQAPLLTAVCVVSRVRVFVTPWPVAHQALLSIEFSRHDYWSVLPFPPPEDLPKPGIETTSPALRADSLPLSHLGHTYDFL